MSTDRPTTDEVREAYASDVGGIMPVDDHGATFDRWLAAHDAEKDAEIATLRLELAKQSDSLALARFDTDELHNLRTSGVVPEEPEWEYGIRLHPRHVLTAGTNLAAFTPPTTPHRTMEHAIEMARLNPGYRATFHRRRKAGPWALVEEEGAES